MQELDLQYPLALLLLVLVPALLHAQKRFVRRTAFSSTACISEAPRPGFVTKHAVDVTGVLFVVAAVCSLANVRYDSYWQKTYLESKWIMLVQDLSGSMGRPAGQRGETTLSDISLQEAQSFVNMRHRGDLIGIVAFSNYAKLICPPTFDKSILRKKLELLGRKNGSTVFQEFAVGGATNASYAVWLPLCVFFMLLPEENRPTLDELTDFRRSLLGRTQKKIGIPEKLKKIDFGQGMAIVLFTDGRIDANKSDEDVRRGIPNFVNVVQLVKNLGVSLYLIVVGGDISSEVKAAVQGAGENGSLGTVFYMPRWFSREKVKDVYRKINEMETNRLLVRVVKKKKETRMAFGLAAMCLLVAYCFIIVLPRYRRL